MFGTHPINWIIYDGYLGTEKIKEIFSEKNFIKKFLMVEAALAEAEAELGVIPKEAAEEISKKASLDYINESRLMQYVRKIGLFSTSIINTWRDEIGEAGEYIHWGATTQDIADTTFMLMAKEAYEILLSELLEIRDILRDLSRKYKNTVIAGRTHGIHAVPMTFGLKTLVWLDEISRHISRLKEMKDRVFVGNITGAVGTFAAMGEEGMEIQKLALEKLGLNVPKVCWHAARDRVAEFINTLTLVASTLSKIAKQIITLSRTEIGEVEEPIYPGRVGSSTMPHKKNPLTCESVAALAKVMRGYSHAMLEAMETLDERNMETWFAEFIIVPEACILVSAIINNMKFVLKELVVYPENMLRNLNITGGLINSEAVMMYLARKIGRQAAYKVVYNCSMKAQEEKRSFKEVLLEDPEVKKYLTEEELDKLLDPTRYIGLSREIVDIYLKEEK